MSWRISARTAGRRGITVTVLIAAAALGAGGMVAAAQTAGARPLGAGATAAIVHQVGAAAQRGTLAYWTPARMASAQAAPQPGAPKGGTIPAGVTLPQLTAAAPPKGIPTAVHFAGVPTTGALFSSSGSQNHFCTADVVDSTAGDLVITAAHCVDGNGFATNIEYIPDWHDGHDPYGPWPVTSITVAAGWQKSHDPDLDFAFLTVGSAGTTKIQSVTGGLELGFTLWYRETIEVIGYNDTDTEPVKCQTKSFKFRDGQMEFYCHGYWTGTSGGPWIIGYNARTGGGTVFGGIGGYQEGGRYEWASYSPYFGSQLRILFQEAEAAALRPTPTPTPTATATPTPTATPTATAPATAARSQTPSPSGS